MFTRSSQSVIMVCQTGICIHSKGENSRRFALNKIVFLANEHLIYPVGTENRINFTQLNQ